MKKKTQKISMWLMSAAFVFGVVSCNDAKYTPMSTAAYIAEAQAAPFKKVTVDDKGGHTTITPTVAQPLQEDSIKLEIVYDTLAVHNFNKRNGTDYIPLPKGSYTLGQKEVTIKKGNVTGPVVNVKMNPFTTKMIESGNKYVLPLSLKKVSGNVPLLESKKSLIYVIDQVIITSVPILDENNVLNVDAPLPKLTLDKWTVEYRVNINELSPEKGSNHAQTLVGFYGKDSKGDGTEFYTRFGDAPIPGNLFQLKTQGTQVNSVSTFNANQWYHIAIVNDGVKVKVYIDGKLDASMDSPGKQLGTDDRFYLSGGNNSSSKAIMYSEFRLWSVVRTQTQIQNNEFTVNPKTPGLEVYFKLNEGKGNAYTDASGHGYTAHSAAQTNWKSGIRSDEK